MTGRGIAEAVLLALIVGLVLSAVFVDGPGAGARAVSALLASISLAAMVWQRRSGNVPSTVAKYEQRPLLGAAWWLGTAVPFGIGTWATFLYLGVRLRRARYLIWSVLYFGALVAASRIVSTGGGDHRADAIATWIMVAIWFGGAGHALIIRNHVRDDLDALLAARLR